MFGPESIDENKNVVPLHPDLEELAREIEDIEGRVEKVKGEMEGSASEATAEAGEPAELDPEKDIEFPNEKMAA